jgi:hypothetical protein
LISETLAPEGVSENVKGIKNKAERITRSKEGKYFNFIS